MKKRLLAIILVLIMLITVIASCGTGNQESSETTTNTATDASSMPSTNTSDDVSIDSKYLDENNKYKAILEEKDFDGREFRVLVRGSRYDTYKSDDFTTSGSWMYGELIETAVFERNAKVEETYNVLIKPILSDNVPDDIKIAMTAGVANFDAVMPSLPQLAKMATENMFFDLASLPHIDLEAPWWDKNATSAFSIGHKVFFTTGDITILNKVCSPSILFNKMLVEENTLENPYELVRNHEWTFDKMISMAKQVAVEAENDSDKIFGMLSSYGDPMIFVGCSGSMISKKDDDDMLVFSFDNPDSILATEKVLEAFQDSASWNLFAQECPDPVWVTSLNYFQNNQVLFRPSGFSAATKLRNSEVEFGILPIPKLYESQEDYISYSGTNEIAGVAIPTFVDDPDFSAFILEACAAEAKNYITPAYIEVNLKYKDAQDDESLDMLNIIFSNIVYDPGEVYNLGSINTMFSELVKNRSTNVVSELDARIGAIEKSLDDILAFYK